MGDFRKKSIPDSFRRKIIFARKYLGEKISALKNLLRERSPENFGIKRIRLLEISYESTATPFPPTFVRTHLRG